MPDETIDLLAEINEAAKEFQYAPEIPDEPDKPVEEVTETVVEAEVPVVPEVKAQEVNVDELVASKVKEVEERYKNRVDLSTLDPDTYFTKTGQDKELFFKRELFARAKEGSPLKDQLKKDLADYESKSEITKLRNEMQASKQAEEARKYIDSYRSSAREYVTKLDEKVAPVLAKLSKGGESDWVLDEIMSEVSRDAQERFAKGDNGDPLTPEQALKRLEAKYGRFAKVFTPAVDKKAPKAKSDVIVKTTPPPPAEGGQDWIDKMLKEAEIEWLRESRKQ